MHALTVFRTSLGLLLAGLGVVAADRSVAGRQQETFRFKSGVELINVSATVTDRSGRFATGLNKDDFRIYEDNTPVEVTHFSADRAPVLEAEADACRCRPVISSPRSSVSPTN